MQQTATKKKTASDDDGDVFIHYLSRQQESHCSHDADTRRYTTDTNRRVTKLKVVRRINCQSNFLQL